MPFTRHLNFFSYYFCPSELGNPSSHQCPVGYVFDPSLPDAFPCRFTRGRTDLCITASCPSTPTVLRYPNMTPAMGQVGFFCIASSIFIYRCGANTQFVVNNSVPSCNSVCVTEGQRNVDPENPSQYTVCYFNELGNQLLRTNMSCPRNYTYHARRNECVEDLSDIENIVDTLCPSDSLSRVATAFCPARA